MMGAYLDLISYYASFGFVSHYSTDSLTCTPCTLWHMCLF